MPDVTIIGAGISGLSCAYSLKKLGIDAVVLEASDRPGGVIQTENIDGYLVERGPNTFQLTPRAFAMIDEIGLWEDLQAPVPHAPRYIYLNGRLRKFPLGLLSFSGMARVLGEWFVRSKSPPDESVGEFFRRRFGPEVRDHLVAPLLTGIYAADADRLSMAAVFPKMIQMEQEHGSLTRAFLRSLTRRSTAPETGSASARAAPESEPRQKPKGTIFSFLTGMEALPVRLAETVSVRYHVKDIHIGDAPATVLAIPAYSAAQVLAAQNSSLAQLLKKVEYASMVIAATSLPEESLKQPLRGFGFLVPRDQDLHLLGTLFSSALFSGRAPNGRILLTSFIGGTFEPEALNWSDERVWEVVCSELKHVLNASTLPEPVALFRHRYAIPQYKIGHERWIHSVGEELSRSPGLFLTANYLEGVSVPACMEQAERTAHAVAEYLRRDR